MNRREFIGGAVACAAAGCVTAKSEWRPRERLRGFNLLGMFKKKIAAETVAVDPQWTRTPGFFREEDFALLKEWGFNFARLPLDYRIWIRGNDWKAIDGDALKPLDEAIRFGQRYGIHVQICLHRAPGYCINPPAERADLFRSTEAFDAMATHWRHFAERYRGIPTDDLSFDLLNEPHNHPISEIEGTFAKLIDVVREVDADRFIIANGGECGRRPLPALFGKHNVGFSMRGYEPFHISHHKAEWWDPPPRGKLAWPPKGPGSGRAWLEKHVFSWWKETLGRGEFLMSNEFGCYRYTPHDIALAWFKDMLDMWRERNIGWALWNLSGTFGVLDSQRTDITYENYRGHLLDREMLELLQNS